VVYSEDGRHAVLLHKLSDRSCDPFTFDKGEDGKWRLNLKAIGLGLGHTYGNVWYLNSGMQEESGLYNYYFGFKDYFFWRHDEERFDHQGFPTYHLWGVWLSHVYDGSRITKIHGDGSFIAKTGLREGDLIVRWEDAEKPHQYYLTRRLTNAREGLDVYIEYMRDGKKHHMLVKAPPKPKEEGQLRWGMTYESDGPRMPLVHYVRPDSPAQRLGLQPGDFILRWNDEEQPSHSKVYKLMRQAKPDERVSVDVIRGSDKITLEGTAVERRVMGKIQ
jgi:hypothetical protein